jgi:adenylate cyclase class IV
VINCSKKNSNIEYCFECKQYPCLRYTKQNEKDSFITYRDVTKNLKKAKEDLDEYLRDLKEKERLLGFLLEKYDNGRMKNYYCIAVNLLEAEDINDLVDLVEIEVKDKNENKIRAIKEGIETMAEARSIEIRLRK